ncbi:CENP-S associating centromere protein X-domain-containing protein [Aspergillus crustosus]
MPPERQPTQKRRHLPFKPPIRASASTSTSTTTAGPSKPLTKKTSKTKLTTATTSIPKSGSRTVKTSKISKAPSRKKPSASPTRSRSTSSPSNNSETRASSPSDSISDLDPGSADEANYILAEITHTEPAQEDVLSSDPSIPPKLLTKLVHHHFRNKKTKMAKDANAVIAKYIDVFVREAVARAALEREEGNNAASGGSRVGDGFLEVEDLEKMGPQLAMDF